MSRAAPILLAALVLAGCGGEDEPTAPPGPLTVEQALEHERDDPVEVRGFVLVDLGEDVRLCSALAESYPPQCGGPSLVVEGVPAHELPPFQRAQGVGWTGEQVTLCGTVDDGTLRVLATR